MDTKELVRAAAARFKHSESKLQLHEKYGARLTIPYAGGLWNITPEFIAYLRGSSYEVVILDIYNTPIKIETAKLLDLAENTYKTIMNEWYEEYQLLNKNR